MDAKKWEQIKKGRFCVCYHDVQVTFEILFNIEQRYMDKWIKITDVAKFIGKACIIISEDEIEANKKFYLDIVANDLWQESDNYEMEKRTLKKAGIPC